MAIASVNPATGETIATFEPLSRDELFQRVARAHDVFLSFRRTTFPQRAVWMHRAAALLEERAKDYARTITLEMGKPVAASIAEVQKCALACRYYAENAERALSDEEVKTKAKRSFIAYQPLGVVLAVMPWNFPFWQVFRFAAPALMAGNTGLLKHASNVPQSALAIEEVFRDAGFPPDVFQTLLIGSSQVGELLDDDRIAAATLTGSEAAGADVASRAGKQIKKVVLELGGSDPFIVMPSADLEQAVEIAVKARIVNNGQSCIAAKRFIVHAKIANEFTQKFVERMKKLKIGDPLDESTEVGPLSSKQIVEDLEKQVRVSVKLGAKIATGGEANGNYYAPTVLTDVPPDSPAAKEELFGPVASIFAVKDIDEAIRVANSTEFGLGAAAWTNDPEEQIRFIRDIEAGAVFINAMVASDPAVPFGGVKKSGFGRELGWFGIREFVNIKTVWIEEPKAKKSE